MKTLLIFLLLVWLLIAALVLASLDGRLQVLEQTTLQAPASITGQTIYVLTVGDYRALHSWGPFSSWQAAYDRLAELGLLGETWEIAPRVVDGPLSSLQAAQP